MITLYCLSFHRHSNYLFLAFSDFPEQISSSVLRPVFSPPGDEARQEINTIATGKPNVRRYELNFIVRLYIPGSLVMTFIYE